MTTTTKRDASVLIKNMGIFLMILFMFIATGCKDEPEEPMPFNCIPATILHGQWMLESFTPEDGPLEEINCLFTIKPFKFKNKNANKSLNNGIEFWTEGFYAPTVSDVYDPDDRLNQGFGYVMLCKRKRAMLSTSKICRLSLYITDEAVTGLYDMDCDDLVYEDGILTAKAISYVHALYFHVVMEREGIVRFRKIK